MDDREYVDYFDKIFKKMTARVEDHQFRHYNHALGMWIYSKAQYKYEMKKRRMVPYDECEKMAEQWDKDHPRKDYGELSPKAMSIVKSLKMTADKNGNISLGNRAIEALKDIGVMSTSEHIPKHMPAYEGGFS